MDFSQEELTQILKIFKAEVATHSSLKQGEISVINGEFVVGCGENTAIKLVTVQPEGKKAMAACDFVKGYNFSKEAYLCSTLTQDI